MAVGRVGGNGSNRLTIQFAGNAYVTPHKAVKYHNMHWMRALRQLAFTYMLLAALRDTE